MWNIVPIQAVFFMGIVAVWIDSSEPGRRYLGRAVALAMIATQAMFFVGGADMTRAWDDTEVRELIIALGFLIYGMAMARPEAFHTSEPVGKVTAGR